MYSKEYMGSKEYMDLVEDALLHNTMKYELAYHVLGCGLRLVGGHTTYLVDQKVAVAFDARKKELERYERYLRNRHIEL